MSKLARHSRFTTRDLDEARARMTGLFRCQFDSLDYKNFGLTIETATLEMITVSTMESTGGMRTRTTREPHSYLLPRIEAGAWDYQSHKERLLVKPGEAILAPPSSDERSHLMGAFSSTSLRISVNLVEAVAFELTGGPVQRPLKILGPLDMRANGIGHWIDFIVEQLAADYGLFEKHPLLGRGHQRMLVETLIKNTHNNYQPLLGRHMGGSARRHMVLAEEYVEAHPQEATVSGAAHAAGVNERTLRDSCERMYGQSPEKFCRTLRLHLAHRRMERPEPTDTVASIAHHFGFTNIWRFNRYYERVFHGETPKETLDRGLRRIGVEPGEEPGSN